MLLSDTSIGAAVAQSDIFAALFSQLAIFPLRPIVRAPDEVRCTCSQRADCDRIGKHPDVLWGEIKAGEKRWLNFADKCLEGVGYGICTGHRSGVFCVDLDGEDAIRAFYRMGPVPQTFTVRRGNDRGHLYFWSRDHRIKTTASKLAPKIDIRGNGGFIVSPCSPHRSGDTYVIADDVPIADAPDWLLDWDGLYQAESIEAAGVVPEPPAPGTPEEAVRMAEAVEYLQSAPPAIAGEKGHTTLWLVAQTLVRSIELPLETSYALIAKHYNGRCRPRWSEREIWHKLEEARDCGHFETRSEVERFNARLLAAANARAS
jgi:hypothetical protein